MNTLKLSLLSFTSLVGITAAFASKAKTFNGTTYYAISDGHGHWTWTSVSPDPNLYWCVPSTPYCTIVTNQTPNYVPPANQQPDPNKISFRTGIHSAWQRIPQLPFIN